MASDHRFAKIKRWLSPPDCSTNANLARKHRHPGTGTWLLNSPAFQEWKLGSRQHLWLYDLAGCGKTILSTTILDHLLQIDTHTTLAFFFDFSDPGKQKLENLLRSLAVQLYHTGNEAAKRLDSLFTSHDDGRRQPNTTTLSACVNAMIRITGKVFVIIDALDECTAREELLQWLKHLASRKAQLIFTGRPEVEFQSAIPRSFGKRNCVQLNKNVVNGDIRSYVEATLEQKPDFVDKKLSPSILEEIRDKIGDGADGMFRWAACQLETLARCLSPAAIEIALESQPLLSSGNQPSCMGFERSLSLGPLYNKISCPEASRSAAKVLRGTQWFGSSERDQGCDFLGSRAAFPGRNLLSAARRLLGQVKIVHKGQE